MRILKCGGVVLAGVMALTALPGWALALTTEAGKLREAVGDNTDVKSLVVSGQINAVDFDFICSEMLQLDNLDLSGCAVVAYEGEATRNGRTHCDVNTLPEGALMSVKASTIHLPTTIVSIGSGALADIDVTSIVIPRFVRTIGESAFSNSRKLESIVLPASVKSVGAGAFSGCTVLKTVEIAGELDSIASETFEGCVGLESVSLPEGIRAIGNGAFAGCAMLEGLMFPQSVERIGSRAFYGTGLRDVDLGNSRVESIGDWAFAGAAGLETVVFPGDLTSIGRGAFFCDSNLRLDEIPATVNEIDDYALAGIGNAGQDVIANTGVERIGNYALANWKGVQKLVLPASLGYMGDGAMAGWSDLAAISAEATVKVPALGDDVWRGVDKKSVILTVPKDLFPDYVTTPQWADFNIQAGSTGSDAPVVSAEKGDVAARFDGLTLVLTASVDIAGVEIYDVSGRRFALPVVRGNSTARVDTSAWNSPVMIVRVVLADGSAAALKLSR